MLVVRVGISKHERDLRALDHELIMRLVRTMGFRLPSRSTLLSRLIFSL